MSTVKIQVIAEHLENLVIEWKINLESGLIEYIFSIHYFKYEMPIIGCTYPSFIY